MFNLFSTKIFHLAICFSPGQKPLLTSLMVMFGSWQHRVKVRKRKGFKVVLQLDPKARHTDETVEVKTFCKAVEVWRADPDQTRM